MSNIEGNKKYEELKDYFIDMTQSCSPEESLETLRQIQIKAMAIEDDIAYCVANDLMISIKKSYNL